MRPCGLIREIDPELILAMDDLQINDAGLARRGRGNSLDSLGSSSSGLRSSSHSSDNECGCEDYCECSLDGAMSDDDVEMC